MRRTTLVATAALIAALALAGVPAPAGSRSPSEARAVDQAAFTAVKLATIDAPATGAEGAGDASLRSAGTLSVDSPFAEPGVARVGPTSRPTVSQPSTSSGTAWKTPLYSVTGIASFYDAGYTAMRLPYGTIIRVCGSNGCLERKITDYGPTLAGGRLIDMYRADFFTICGCAWWAGTTSVTVSVY